LVQVGETSLPLLGQCPKFSRFLILEASLRTFVARLRGLANIFILYTQCTDAHMEPTILLALVKGLADGDTKGEILSKLK
jgi:hypothetical protein